MYQFYYADIEKDDINYEIKDSVHNHFNISAIRPVMWEEHCLECSAPLCFKNCIHYMPRKDGRCKRFENGFLTFEDKNACCGQGAHIKFRKWANMMSIVFPAMMDIEKYQKLHNINQKTGIRLKRIINSKLPVNLIWGLIRVREFVRRSQLRKMNMDNIIPDAFIFHGYSYVKENFNLILEVYDDHTPLYKMALNIKHGENMFILNNKDLSQECWKPNNLIKIYPENNIEAELDILWCDFVQGLEVVPECKSNKVKCVVWDLDNTLWNGTLIETEDVKELCLREGVRDIIKKLDERGIIQSIASKNDFDNAWPVIEQLGLEKYFLYPQIHWNAKSVSIEQIAGKLNIGIDSIVLIDDSAYERNQVMDKWPQVRTYDACKLEGILELPEFTVTITDESKNRRLMYQAEEKRNILRDTDNSDTLVFLKKCNLKINIFEPKTDKEILRCYELVVRTNQLNMSGKKYTREEFNGVLQRSEHKNIAFSCKDDFGEYGIVGFGQYYIHKDEIIFTEFALSCRVAGKYVESALFKEILRREDCKQGQFNIIITKKNILLRRTLQEIGFSIIDNNSKNIKYSFDNELKNSDIVEVI